MRREPAIASMERASQSSLLRAYERVQANAEKWADRYLEKEKGSYERQLVDHAFWHSQHILKSLWKELKWRKKQREKPIRREEQFAHTPQIQRAR